jgi:hypothetical protein
VKPAAAAVVVALVTTVASLAPSLLPAEEKNLVGARNGAQVIKYTSELGGEWRAEKLIDEQITPAGWASADGSLPQEIIFRLPPSRASTRWSSTRRARRLTASGPRTSPSTPPTPFRPWAGGSWSRGCS